jgi:hypothetical protein
MGKSLILALLLPGLCGIASVSSAQSSGTPSLDQPAPIPASAQLACGCKKPSKTRQSSGNIPDHHDPPPQEKGGNPKEPPLSPGRGSSDPGSKGSCSRNSCCVVAAAKLLLAPASQGPPPLCADQTKAEREDQVVILQAESASLDKDWDNAQKLYATAMKSCVPWIALKASNGYVAVRGWSSPWWWSTPILTPIVRGFVRYPWACCIFLGLLLGCLAWLLLWLRLRDRDFSGRARLLLPAKLTDDGLPELFAAAVYQGSQDVDKCLRTAGENYFAGALNLVSAPAADLENLTEKLPEISGVSFGKWVSFMLAVPRYFTWRVETWQGFLKSGNDGQIRVRALLCRAGSIHEKWDFTRAAADKYDLEETAFALAARLKGEAIFRSGSGGTEVRFAAAESFCLFIEGLRALGKYSAEADSSKPRKEKLDAFLHRALDCLQQCEQEYPEDLLSRFYFGIALTVSNQAYYVERLYDLRDSFAAWGTLLDIQDATGPVDAERLSQRVLDLTEKSRAAQQLGAEDWIQLKQAATIFTDLSSQSTGTLMQAAAYNLAGVYGRLGKEEDIRNARKLLDGFEPLKSGPLRWVSGLFAGPRADESRALSLQAAFEKDILDYWLEARGIVLGGNNAPEAPAAIRSNFDRVSSNLDATVSRIQSCGLPENMRFDLEAEFWCKRAYLRYELATHIESRTWLPGWTGKDHLKKAKEYLENALRLKPHWNPAQVYMALVLQVMGDPKGADAYFQSLRGVERPSDTARPAMAAD